MKETTQAQGRTLSDFGALRICQAWFSRGSKSVACTLLALSMTSGLASANMETDVIHEDQLLTWSGANEGDKFGSAVALGTDWLFAGAPYNDGGDVLTPNLGIVLNFSRHGSTWEPAVPDSIVCHGKDAIGDPKCLSGASFGHSLAIAQLSGGSFYLAIGRERVTGLQEAKVEVLYNDGSSWDWTPRSMSEPHLIGADEEFGVGLSVSGSGVEPVALAGAPKESGGTGGVAFLPLNQASRYNVPGEGGSTNFGRSVAVDANRAAVGADKHVYLLTRSNDDAEFSISAGISAPEDTEGFGESVAIQDNLLLVGAPSTKVDGNKNVGRAYLYDFDSPTTAPVTLDAPEPITHERLGYSVSFGKGYAAVAAPGGGSGDSENEKVEGRVLIFDLVSHTVEAELMATQPGLHDFFGSAMDAEGMKVAVGAPAYSDNHGAVFLFTVPAPEPVALLGEVAVLVGLGLTARRRRT